MKNFQNNKQQIMKIRRSGKRKGKNTASNNLKIQTEAGKNYEIPFEGSLGLLASGYLGIMAWRQKRKEVLEKQGKLK